MKLKESNTKWDVDKQPFQMLFTSKYIFENGNSVLADCGYCGSFLVESTDRSQIYGVLFKDKNYEYGLVGLKCFIYEYPQDGLLNGTTFWSTSKSFQTDIKKYVR